MEKTNLRFDPARTLDLAIEISFMFLVLFAPLFFDRRIGIVFSLSKATWIRAFTIIIIALWGTKAMLLRKLDLRNTFLDIPVLTYILCVSAACLLSINVLVSLIGSYGRYEGFITILNYVILFFITVNFIDTDEKKRRVFILAVISAVVMSAYGIIQRVGIDPYQWGGVLTQERVIATIGQPNFLAAYLDMAFMLGLVLLLSLKPNEDRFVERTEAPLSKKDRKNKTQGKAIYKVNWTEILFNLRMTMFYAAAPVLFMFSIYFVDGYAYFYQWVIMFFAFTSASVYFAFRFEEVNKKVMQLLLVASLMLMLVGILSTQSRGGWLGFICGLAVMFIVSGRKLFFDHLKVWSVLGGLSLIMVLLSFMSIGSNQSSRFQEIGVAQQEGGAKVELKGAVGSRVETWTSAYHFIPDRPLFGVGPEVIKMVFPQYETALFRFKEAFHVKQDRCHNEILDMSVTRGLFTLAIYIWLLFLSFRSIISAGAKNDARKLFAGGLAGAMTAYLIQNQFSFGVVAITSLFWIMIGMTAVEGSNVQSRQEGKSNAGVREYTIIALIWVIALLSMVVSSYPYIADKYFKSAKTYSDSGMMPQAIGEFENTMKFLAYDGGYYTNYGMSVLNGSVNAKDRPAEIEKAISVFAQGQQADPYNADNYYMAGRAYLMLGDLDHKDHIKEAQDLSNKAIIVDPYYSESYQNLGIILERSGKTGDAIKMYEKAFISNPTYTDLAMSIYRYYKQAGTPQKAFEVFEKVLELSPSDSSLLVLMGDCYQEIGLNDKAMEKYDQALSADPGNVKAVVGKGMIAVNLNKLEEAKQIFDDAVMKDPENPQLHDGLGLYYMKTNDRQKAKDEFTLALKLAPTDEFAKNMLGRVK